MKDKFQNSREKHQIICLSIRQDGEDGEKLIMQSKYGFGDSSSYMSWMLAVERIWEQETRGRLMEKPKKIMNTFEKKKNPLKIHSEGTFAWHWWIKSPTAKTPHSLLFYVWVTPAARWG